MTRQSAFAYAANPPDPRPRQIVTDSTDAFLAVCARQDRGELVIMAVARGEGNAQWICEIGYD